MKDTKGITLVALVVTVIVLIILAAVTINLLIGTNGIITRTKEGAENWSKAEQAELNALNSIDWDKYINGGSTLVADGSFDGKINTPILKDDMTAVVWNGTDWEEATSNSEWYNYDNNEWANATTADGSYWVWIPRFEYIIDYTTNGVVQGTNTDYTKAGTIEVNFIGKDATASSGYTVHPAFTTSIANGGWSSNLAGFWVAKYEMSMETNEATTTPTSTGTGNIATGNALIANSQSSNGVRAVSKAGVSSWRYINIANCYENSYYYDRTKESHLIKNSEWGAVAYLTHSKYGRNGTEVTINNSSTYITGNAGNTISASLASGVTNSYETNAGQLASSTGNITGIYDLSGGAYEYVAGFNSVYSGTYYTGASYLNAKGTHFASNEGTSTQYATAYSNSSSSTYYATSYSDFTNGRDVSHTGDGIHEVWVSSDRGWFSEYSYFVYSDGPFFERGGGYANGVNAGVFYSSHVSRRQLQQQQFSRSACTVTLILDRECKIFCVNLRNSSYEYI